MCEVDEILSDLNGYYLIFVRRVFIFSCLTFFAQFLIPTFIDYTRTSDLRKFGPNYFEVVTESKCEGYIAQNFSIQ